MSLTFFPKDQSNAEQHADGIIVSLMWSLSFALAACDNQSCQEKPEFPFTFSTDSSLHLLTAFCLTLVIFLELLKLTIFQQSFGGKMAVLKLF